nr:hypothetical protein [Actinomadura montaniterrae]
MRTFIRREPLKEVSSDLLGCVEFGARFAKTLVELDQLCPEVSPLGFVIRRRHTDVGAASCPNLNKPLIGKQLDRRRRRIHRDSMLYRQLAIRGQPLTGRIPARFPDLCPQQGREAPTR